eukprot:TRINITY_DN17662_c0_g1_i1.p2 TRINITY_DN17662_c0_g1~~TRINITY_DN17662_c0_g1_i1.p2  ORF type:complete len:194 (+),score=55.51 TRINITY_DN17662_c0_g1_i1:37-582(+)
MANFQVVKKDHFAAPSGGSGRAVTVPFSGADAPPSTAVQALTLWHYYNGGMEFYMPDVGEPKFPSDYCKVALLECSIADVMKITDVDDGSWVTNPAVKDTWAWVHYKKSGQHGKRGTCVGDAVVEADGRCWRVESRSWHYMGKFPDFAAAPPATGAAKVCAKCSAKLDPNSRFCCNCGSPL